MELQVALEAHSVRKCPPARPTLKRLLPRVDPLVYPYLVRLREPSVAHVAAEGLLGRVCLLVADHVALFGKRPVAAAARVRALPGVRPLVGRQGRGLRKRPLAQPALEGPLARVHAFVAHDVKLVVARVGAVAALELALPGVVGVPQVEAQQLPGREEQAALVAEGELGSHVWGDLFVGCRGKDGSLRRLASMRIAAGPLQGVLNRRKETDR